ncbi:DUF1801 domain-containing protein [Flavobacterium sp.]|uniref:DUF1801 domain-containing protein n=1 Tax=Flavobacterium sp. TaxID=239 RepID=UPI0024872343|nr:DUF1801 domain-containing protein [Flavobacterium sp.]MDI1315699.1 DUF1801 domain-containing protein [Flavobacterium sp.]
MQSNTTTPEEYLSELPEDRKMAMTKLRNVIKDKLPKGFKEVMSYGMIGYVVPHESYPSGYHCNPKLPLPFINLGSQKNFIAIHHLGIYADTSLSDWFVAEYPKHVKTKLDMGKGCIRFKKMDTIPFELLGELASKMTMQEWIKRYEKNLKR